MMKKFIKNASIGVLTYTASLCSYAEIKTSKFFGDHMMFQQETKAAVWGYGEPGEAVTVKASWGKSVSGKTNEEGKWKVFLETPSHGGPYEVSIKGSNEILLKDVMVGEVWLCAGQSNMGWAVQMTFKGEEEVANDNFNGIRIFRSVREHWHEPLDESRDLLARWKVCDPKVAGATSAVSYYFARKIHKELGIPVGVIQQSYSGTPIEGWMPKEVQTDDPRLSLVLEEFVGKENRGSTPEKALAKYEKDLNTYKTKIANGETMKNKVKELKPPYITKPATLGHQYPGHIYNAMIHPVRPFAFRGMLWYQGERNAKTAQQAENYRSQIARLINYYRSSWHKESNGNTDPQFPVFFTQLPSWHAPQTKPVEGVEATWAVSREMMRLAANEIPNAGMAVSIDTGDAVQLHPKNKKPIGLRHAYLALKQVYGKDFVDYGPRYKKLSINGNKVELEFDSVGSGLMTAKEGTLDAFAVAGEDKIWHWATGKISGDKVIVTSPEVSNPVALRYAWGMNPSTRNLLYNKEGIPASPFRTDNWPLYPAGSDEVRVTKPAKTKEKATEDWARPTMTQ